MACFETQSFNLRKNSVQKHTLFGFRDPLYVFENHPIWVPKLCDAQEFAEQEIILVRGVSSSLIGGRESLTRRASEKHLYIVGLGRWNCIPGPNILAEHFHV